MQRHALGAEPTPVQFHRPSRAICRRISKTRRSTDFTSGHAAWPPVVEVMERIESKDADPGEEVRERLHSMI